MTSSCSTVTVRVSVISLLNFEFDCPASEACSPDALQTRLDALFPQRTGRYGFVAEVSEPLKSGYVTLKYPIRAERVRISAPPRRTRFRIYGDPSERAFDGYASGDEFDGGRVALFTLEQGLAVIAALALRPERYCLGLAQFDAGRRAFILRARDTRRLDVADAAAVSGIDESVWAIGTRLVPWIEVLPEDGDDRHPVDASGSFESGASRIDAFHAEARS